MATTRPEVLDVNVLDGTEVLRPMSDEEYDQYLKDQQEWSVANG